MTLQEFIVGCSYTAAKVFQLRGKLSPMWHAITRDGQHLMVPSPHPDKDAAVTLMRALFELRDVVRYVLINEAWTVEVEQRWPGEEVEALNERSRQLGGILADHPDRVEVLMLIGEDETAGLCTARRVIHRPPNAKPYLGPLEIDEFEVSEGRLVGLLPQRGTRQ